MCDLVTEGVDDVAFRLAAFAIPVDDIMNNRNCVRSLGQTLKHGHVVAQLTV